LGARWSADGVTGGLVVQSHDLADVTNLKTAGDGPGAMTWLAEGNLSAASIASGELLYQPTSGGNRRWGVYSAVLYWAEAPWLHFPIPRIVNGVIYPVTLICHIAAGAAVSGAIEEGVLGVCEDSDTPASAKHTRAGVGRYNSVTKITADDNDNFAQGTLTDAEDGAWVRIRVDEDGAVTTWGVDDVGGATPEPATEAAWGTAIRTITARFDSTDSIIRGVLSTLEDTSAGRQWKFKGLKVIAPWTATVS